MSYAISQKTTDTAVTGVASMSMPVKVTNFDADYRVASRSSSEVILQNMQSPTTAPRSYRFGVKNVANIFGNSPVVKTPECPSSVGTQVLIGINDTITIEESVSGKAYQLPIRSHLVITLPNDPLVTKTVVYEHVQRLVAGLFEQGVVDDARLNALMHGILTPAVLDK